MHNQRGELLGRTQPPATRRRDITIRGSAGAAARGGWPFPVGATPSPVRSSSPLDYPPSRAANARCQPLPEAEATQERTLEAVGCTPLILIEAPSPADHRGMLRVAKPVSQTRRRPPGDSTPNNTRL